MAIASNLVTPEEYLRAERTSEQKHEYMDGQVLAMAGANRKHRQITNNILSHLMQSTRGTGCEPDNSETRLYIPASNRYTYADGVMTCGEQQYLDDKLDTLLNPGLIVEVLSASTEAYDRGEKFRNYRSIPSFCEYLTVAQDRILVEQLIQVEGANTGDWLYTAYESLDSAVSLIVSGLKLPLQVIYGGVSI